MHADFVFMWNLTMSELRLARCHLTSCTFREKAFLHQRCICAAASNTLHLIFFVAKPHCVIGQKFSFELTPQRMLLRGLVPLHSLTPSRNVNASLIKLSPVRPPSVHHESPCNIAELHLSFNCVVFDIILD